MSIFINPGVDGYQEILNSPIFVDKTMLLSLLNQRINTTQKYVCVSRPRRFGKSVTAQMLCAYYGKNSDDNSHNSNEPGLFDQLAIASHQTYRQHLNHYHVIYLNLATLWTPPITDINQLIQHLNIRIRQSLQEIFCDCKLPQSTDLSDLTDLSEIFSKIYQKNGERFVFVIDEWDSIMRESRDDHQGIRQYFNFLRNLFKDNRFTALAYMTGILPIKKYGTQSALNMFTEISMTEADEFAPYMGFTAAEVKNLCRQIKLLKSANSDAAKNDRIPAKKAVSFTKMKTWYDGYTTGTQNHVFNPNSVVRALYSGICRNYWGKTESFEAVKPFIELNQAGLQESILSLLAGDELQIKISTFQNDLTTFTSRDDVLTLLVHLGYLSASADGIKAKKTQSNYRRIRIPNQEIHMELEDVLQSSQIYKETVKAINSSEKLLQAIWDKDSQTVAAAIHQAHLENVSILQYNDENSLACTLTCALYAARNYYTRFFELPTGDGFADIAFIPKRLVTKPALLVELKRDDSSAGAIAQIKNRQYPQGLSVWQNNLLLVGINYNSKSHQHTCIIENAVSVKHQ